MRLHIDTDAGDNPDDACALAMALGQRDVELAGITTVADPDGARCDFVNAVLEKARRTDVPVVSGSDSTACDSLLRASIRSGARLVGLGPFTNLARLEQDHPGSLAGVPVTLMGGWLGAPRPGLPRWRPERDHNTRQDIAAARVVWDSDADLTLVPLAVAGEAALREADLAELESTGPLGRMLSELSRAHGFRRSYAALGRSHPGLPDDLVNFHFDPVACAVATGWAGAMTEAVRLRQVVEDGAVRYERDARGRRTSVVVAVDGAAFGTAWLAAVSSADRTEK